MDWLKGKIGKSGVLAADDIPEAVKAEIALKEQKEKEAREAEEAVKQAELAADEKTENEPETVPDKKKTGKSKSKKTAKSKETKKVENVAVVDKNPEDTIGTAKEKSEEKAKDETAVAVAERNADTEAVEEGGDSDTKEKEQTSAGEEKADGVEGEQLNLFTEDYMANDEKATKKVAGKWIVKEKGEGEYVAFLYANNKEVLLTSETYSTVEGAKKGVATIKKNATDENFAIYKDKNKNFYFKLKNSKNRFLCAGETYPNRNACLNSIESVKKFVDSPISDAVEKDITLIKYVPTPEDKLPQKKYSGKWIIKEEEGDYKAELHASNGELLLSSESYASYASAKEAIGNISQNGIAGNFIVDSDKKGRYFFKLRNATKVTLCVGETYSQLQACLSAIDSVRSFLKTAKLADNQ